MVLRVGLSIAPTLVAAQPGMGHGFHAGGGFHVGGGEGRVSGGYAVGHHGFPHTGYYGAPSGYYGGHAVRHRGFPHAGYYGVPGGYYGGPHGSYWGYPQFGFGWGFSIAFGWAPYSFWPAYPYWHDNGAWIPPPYYRYDTSCDYRYQCSRDDNERCNSSGCASQEAHSIPRGPATRAPETPPVPYQGTEPPDTNTADEQYQLRTIGNRPPLRRKVQNALETLRGMPPAARLRWIDSGRYHKFSPEERELLKHVSDDQPAAATTHLVVLSPLQKAMPRP
jgi:hypothetical protein